MVNPRFAADFDNAAIPVGATAFRRDAAQTKLASAADVTGGFVV
jgi:hypothetical protein